MPEQTESEESQDEARRDYGREFEEEVKSFLEDKFNFVHVKKTLILHQKEVPMKLMFAEGLETSFLYSNVGLLEEGLVLI